MFDRAFVTRTSAASVKLPGSGSSARATCVYSWSARRDALVEVLVLKAREGLREMVLALDDRAGERQSVPREELVGVEAEPLVGVLEAELGRARSQRELPDEARAHEVVEDAEPRDVVVVRREERVAQGRLPVLRPPPHVVRADAEELARGGVAWASEVRHERLAAVRARHDAHVVVVGEAQARVE